jgi:drug/metabolite transporter (DMT)-like permease
MERPRELPADAIHERRRRLQAIALMCGACACFACLDASAKFLTGHIDILQVVWARYASAFVLTFLVSNPLTRPGLVVTTRPVLQIGRSLLLLFSTLLNVLALRYLQLDQTVSILFSTPFFVALLSGFVLGEWAGWRRWTAIAIGFFGVLLIARPGMGGMHPAALLCVAGAICYSVYNISTRVLARTDSNETTLFYSNFVGTVAALPALPFVWTTPHDSIVIVLMVLIGALGSFGHYLLIAAHRLGFRDRARALHLQPAGLGNDGRLSRVRATAERMDACRRGNRDRLGALHSLPRAQAKGLAAPLALVTSPPAGRGRQPQAAG